MVGVHADKGGGAHGHAPRKADRDGLVEPNPLAGHPRGRRGRDRRRRADHGAERRRGGWRRLLDRWSGAARARAAPTVSGPQQVEAPEVVLDRQDLARGETGLPRVLLDRARTDDGAGPRRALADHSDRQAVEDAEAVEETLDLAGGCRELVLGTL